MLLTAVLVLSLLLTILCLPSIALLAAILFGAVWRKLKTYPISSEVEKPGFLIVIPSHDEEYSIENTLKSTLNLEYPKEKYGILVLADNCTDSTAERARSLGVEVFERTDDSRRSKGYALEDFFGKIIDEKLYLEYQCIVVIDADTCVAKDLLTKFSAGYARGFQAQQAYYSVSNPDSNWRSALMTYAFSLFNGVWEAGLDGIGVGAALRGNGMCFTRDLLTKIPWKVSGLAEDMEYSWCLRMEDVKVSFIDDTKVFGEITTDSKAAKGQRKRWESGRKDIKKQFADKISEAKSLSLVRRALLMADLYTFPLTALGLLVVCGFCLSSVSVSFGDSILGNFLFQINSLFVVVLMLYGLSPFVLMKLPLRYALYFVYIPFYAIWKLFVVLGSQPVKWVRTPREKSTD